MAQLEGLAGMTSLRSVVGVAAVAIVLGSGCRELTGAPSGLALCAREQMRDKVCVAGTVRFFSFEGGFWAVRGDDNVTYDPRGGLPAEFRTEGLRVFLVARERRDLASFHMAGPMVEIISIERLR
jgi:hypothetical protein